MEASIKANRITDFVRLLQCASKFGDDLGISANKDLWELAVTNSSKSAFCLFKLHPAFFCRYKPLGTSVQQRRGVKCQLLVKSLLAVLGKTSSTGNVERVDLKIHDPDHALGGRRRRRRRDDDESDGHGSADEESEDDVVTGIESLLIMKLVCKHGVVKRHSLHLATTDFLRADVDPHTTPSGFLISARTLREWLEHFHIGLTSSHVTTSGGTTTIRQENQLSWLFSNEEVRVKSWEGGSRELSTEVKLDPAEFEQYDVFNGRADLTLPMREFRAALALADQLSIRLLVSFSEATQPLTLTSEVFADSDREPFEIFCAIATTTCDQFVNVRTSSDRNTGARSRSTTSALERNLTRSQSSAANGEEPGEGDERSVRRRLHSERPPTSSRPRLSMSDQQPTHISNSMPTGLAHTRTTSAGGTLPGNRGPARDDAVPLFLPGGSQRDLDDTGDGPPQSQRHTFTQLEVEEMSGLENLDEVMEAMDDQQHEEELEEMRASQRQQEQQEMDEAAEASQRPQSGRPREPLADITVGPDESVLFPRQTQEEDQSAAIKATRADGAQVDDHGRLTSPTLETDTDQAGARASEAAEDRQTEQQSRNDQDPELRNTDGPCQREEDEPLPPTPTEPAGPDQREEDEPLPPTQTEPADQDEHEMVDRQFTSLFND